MRVYKSCCCEVIPIEYLMLVRCGDEDSYTAGEVVYAPNSFADSGVYSTTLGDCYRAFGYVEFYSEPVGLVTVLTPHDNCTRCLCCQTASSGCRAFMPGAKVTRTQTGSAYHTGTRPPDCGLDEPWDATCTASGSSVSTDDFDYDLCDTWVGNPSDTDYDSCVLDDGSGPFGRSVDFGGNIQSTGGEHILMTATVVISGIGSSASASMRLNVVTGVVDFVQDFDPFRFGTPSNGVFQYSYNVWFSPNLPCGGGSYGASFGFVHNYELGCPVEGGSEMHPVEETGGASVSGTIVVEGFETCEGELSLPQMTTLVPCDGVSPNLWTPKSLTLDDVLLIDGACYTVSAATEIGGTIWMGSVHVMDDCEDERCAPPLMMMRSAAPEEDEASADGAKSRLPLGDYVAKATKAVGVKPCGGCKRRQAKLNDLGDKIVDKFRGDRKDGG